MNEQESEEAWWRRIGRTADVLQILGWIGVPTLAVIIGVFFAAGGGGDTQSATSAAGRTTNPPKPVTAVPPTGGAGVTTSNSRPSGELLFDFAINEVYSLGKDKAGACKTAGVFCLIVDRTVSNDDGPVNSGCTMSWQVYLDGTPTLLEKARTRQCTGLGDQT
ncbi:hypothetical protein SK803_19910 [Lentzea sp. BCCO 10_0856]|uniref:Subtilisin inhibitor-like n=1 Tax=Lentzea miocenica TaxID=3095431 RepID=A0ABU4T343_9PSEU|nr:hypothetical protein [Lentzea sp. BCCO 10_0856]MDX8032484.1 hypothetical protein [Lentzea sp. BCCO 10_0856]